jgi:hypothetical protein
MFVGHYGISFIVKRRDPVLPLRMSSTAWIVCLT